MKQLLPLLLSLVLSACATLPADKQANNLALTWSQRQASLSAVTQFTLQGAVIIRQAKKAQSASLYLRQHDRRYDLEIFGPLGIGRNHLIGEPNDVTLITSDGKKLRSTTPEALLQSKLGWSLPVSNLYFWLRALPAPQISHHIEFDAYHHVHQLQQQGWIIVYKQYTAVQRFDLPSLIEMRYGQLRVSIVISQWQLTLN